MNDREWINAHRDELKQQYDGMTVIVCEGKVIKAIKEPITPIEIRNLALQLCPEKEWDYTFVCKKEEYLYCRWRTMHST